MARSAAALTLDDKLLAGHRLRRDAEPLEGCRDAAEAAPRAAQGAHGGLELQALHVWLPAPLSPQAKHRQSQADVDQPRWVAGACMGHRPSWPTRATVKASLRLGSPANHHGHRLDVHTQVASRDGHHRGASRSPIDLHCAHCRAIWWAGDHRQAHRWPAQGET